MTACLSVWCLPTWMMPALQYDVCHFFLPVWCLLNCIMSAFSTFMMFSYLCDVFLLIWCLLNCMMSVYLYCIISALVWVYLYDLFLPVSCRLYCKMSVHLYDVFLSTWCLLNFTAKIFNIFIAKIECVDRVRINFGIQNRDKCCEKLKNSSFTLLSSFPTSSSILPIHFSSWWFEIQLACFLFYEPSKFSDVCVQLTSSDKCWCTGPDWTMYS